MTKQKTIKKEIVFRGIGVHSGSAVKVKIKPAPVNTGIVVKNKNFPDSDIKIGQVVPIAAMHATVLKNSDYFVSTIEHLMSAITWLEIDNLIIETEDQEIPILDGSAAPFVHSLHDSGIIEQGLYSTMLTPSERIIFRDGDRLIEIFPAKRYSSGNFDRNLYVEYIADFDHPLVGVKNLRTKITPDVYSEYIAPARTFGFLDQLPFLKRHGLAKGTSLGNTVVIGEDFLNDARCADEFAKHKLLDFLGDIGLLGKRLAGVVRAERTGHNFNRLVVEHFIKNPKMWLII